MQEKNSFANCVKCGAKGKNKRILELLRKPEVEETVDHAGEVLMNDSL